ncbi:MAG TPA: hypothetical protein VHP33_10180 [Polyangiaceae bacterium]|nr:hypothetical protein [Polyangiaceae bacterium]
MLTEAALLVALTVQQGRGAEACLQAEPLKRGVEKRLKRRVFVQPAQASLRVVVTFARQGAETEARIELSSIDGTPRGTRSLVASGHCSALDDALTLSVALLVDQPPDPEVPAEPAPPAAPAAPAAVAPAAPPTAARHRGPPPTPITLPDDVAAPREPWRVDVGAAAVAAWGVLPDVTPGVALYLKLVPRHFPPILLQGEGFWPSTAERDASSGARFRLFRAELALCPALHQSQRVALSLCAGQKVGWLSVEGYGFDQNQQDRRLVFSLLAGGEGKLRLLAPVSGRAFLGAEVPLARDRFHSGGRNATQLFQASPIALLGEIGLEVALWQ